MQGVGREGGGLGVPPGPRLPRAGPPGQTRLCIIDPFFFVLCSKKETENTPPWLALGDKSSSVSYCPASTFPKKRKMSVNASCPAREQDLRGRRVCGFQVPSQSRRKQPEAGTCSDGSHSLTVRWVPAGRRPPAQALAVREPPSAHPQNRPRDAKPCALLSSELRDGNGLREAKRPPRSHRWYGARPTPDATRGPRQRAPPPRRGQGLRRGQRTARRPQVSGPPGPVLGEAGQCPGAGGPRRLPAAPPARPRRRRPRRPHLEQV